MLTIHHLAQSQSERIVWLCEELGISYELIRYEREPSGSAPPEYRALHAFGTAPVITDDEIVLGESAAIVEYICRRYAQGRLLLGPGHREFVAFVHWFHFANGSFVAALMIDSVSGKTSTSQKPPRPSRSERAWSMIEARLGDEPYFSGKEFTAADIMMDLTRFCAKRDVTTFPNTLAYLQRIAARPAWQRAMNAAEPVPPQPSLHRTPG